MPTVTYTSAGTGLANQAGWLGTGAVNPFGGGYYVDAGSGADGYGAGIRLTVAHSGTGLDRVATLSVRDSLVPVWRRVVDIDFTQQTTQTFSSDGNVTIGGTQFSVLNSGGLYTSHTHPFGIVNGTGLSIPSQASGVTLAAGLAAKTLPQICWPIQSTVNNSNRVRCAILCGASSASSGCNSIVSLTSDSIYGGGYWSKYQLNAVNNTDGFNVPSTSEFGVVISGTRAALATGKQPSYTHSVLGLEMLPGPFRPNSFGCAAIVNWSSLSSLDAFVAWNAPVEVSTSSEIGVDVMGLLSQWSVCLAGALNTPAVGGRTVIKRLVIEIYS